MSKKKTLSPTASLASCLDFAARVLSSTATVQEMCTKQVLAPMVVEAHRCGQQVMKYVDPGIPADVRKLIKVLQTEKDCNLCRGSPLEELEVADLTWDAEGIVADTLEMELVELEKRVVNAQDACVIFSTSGGNGQAVIWFSCKRYESLHKGFNAKNRQILLYVCPGRVKVVKSVDALITKLYEELAPLRVNGATYNVWTVAMGSKSSNQKEEQRVDPEQDTLNGTSNQCADKDELNTVSTRTTVDPEPSSYERTNHLDETDRSAESRKSNITLYTQETEVGPVFRATKESVESAPESQDDKCDPVSPHCSDYRETSDTKTSPVKSIFSFGLQQRTSQELQRRSFEQKPGSLNGADENDNGTDVIDPDLVNAEGESASISSPEVEVESLGDNQIQDTRSIRAVVSASLANFSTQGNGGIPEDSALGLGIKLKEDFVWQSCDGKVLRKTIRGPKELPHSSVEAMESEVQIAVEAARFEEQPDAHAGDDEDVGDCTSDNLQSDEMQKPQDMPQGTPSKVSSVDDKLGSLHISTPIHEPNVDQDRVDHQSVGSSQNSEVVMQAISFVTASTKSTSPDSKSVNDESVNDVVGEPLQTNDLLTGFVGDCDKTEDHSIASSEILQVNTDDPMHRPKSAVNYKDKLGARIWWELAYTARRLEREEMMEKQTLRLVGGQRANRQQPVTTSVRHVKPTLSRNEELMGSHKKLTVPDDQSCVDQQSPKEVDTVERQSANNYSDVPERSLDCSLATSTSSIKKETSPSKIAIPSPSREALSGSSVSGVDKFVTGPSLSVQNVVDDGDSGTTPMLEEVEEVVVECSPSTISSAASCSPIRKTYRSLDQKRESNSAMRESSTLSVVQPSTPPSLETRIEEGNSDDETVAQMMWGSTHTSYERERNTNIYRAAKEDELQTTEAISKIPFIIRGRVPIRSRPVKTPVRGEPSRSSYSELTPPSSNLDHIAGAEQSRDKQIPSRIKLPVYQASTDHKSQPVVPAPPVATFIPLSEENTATSGKTRQERLNDLRQKKLQKLQQARDTSLQLQKEKQSQQTRQPLSFANSIYTKKASNRQLMQNALEFTLLAGGSMEKERLLALQALAESTCDNFIVLLKSAKELKFRALYESHVDRDYATRIYSVLPSTSARAPLKLANSEMISQFFKYSSAKKQFLPVPTRSFTVKTDACALVDQLVFKKNSSSALARLL
ncbi:hypothetical protein DVH05_009936 [Phytophthora capsici]|nr:hypothetical protein DVH05_009936 [Phytophthora capsici]